MFYHKDHISEFLYFSKIHIYLIKAVHWNQNTSFAHCVFNSLGFVTVLLSRESLRTICRQAEASTDVGLIVAR